MKISCLFLAMFWVLGFVVYAQTDSTQQLRVEYKIYYEVPLEEEDPQWRDALKRAMEKVHYHELIMNRKEAVYSSTPTISNDQPTEDAGIYITFNNDDMLKYFNLKDSTYLEQISWPEEYIIKDSLKLGKWELSRDKKDVCGFLARKATFQIKDSLELLAWYAPKLNYSFGPGGYFGLPGVILELEETTQEEDGYFKRKFFCNQVEVLKKKQPLEKPSKGKVVTMQEMKVIWEKRKQKFEEMYGDGEEVDTDE